ncbi:ATP-binding cassette domain-containing protein [Streptomyces vastus]
MADVLVSFKDRRSPALSNVSLRVEESEHVALLGPSGSGKTTLLRSLLGAVPVQEGTIRVDGLDLASTKALRTIRRRTGSLWQNSCLVPGLRAQTNAILGTSAVWGLREWVTALRGAVPRRYEERLSSLADDQGMGPYLRARVEHLSGGQRQRIAVLRAVLPEPRLVLADEPTSGLDPVTAQAAIRTLRGVPGATVLVTTHDLAVARQFPRVIALRQGHLCFDGTDLSDQDSRQIYEGPVVPA